MLTTPINVSDLKNPLKQQENEEIVGIQDDHRKHEQHRLFIRVNPIYIVIYCCRKIVICTKILVRKFEMHLK